MISRLIPVLIYLSNGNCWTKLNQAFVDPRPSNLRYYLSQIGNFSAVCMGKQCSHQETPCSQGRINQLGEFEGALMVPYSARPSSLIHLRKTYSHRGLHLPTYSWKVYWQDRAWLICLKRTWIVKLQSNLLTIVVVWTEVMQHQSRLGSTE